MKANSFTTSAPVVKPFTPLIVQMIKFIVSGSEEEVEEMSDADLAAFFTKKFVVPHLQQQAAAKSAANSAQQRYNRSSCGRPTKTHPNTQAMS